MITEQELQLSNKSYTNKDFASVYPELLNLTKSLTNRWNPEQSNESDPGIVLLKESAFVADKENYNIDKNILEAFMPSATQRYSMQALCEMGGYQMKYYNSAMLSITAAYRDSLSGDSFTLPRYTTTITDASKSIVYSLIEDMRFTDNNSVSAVAIEGTIETLQVGDSTEIHAYNIDSNYRLYIPSKYIAENGFFINNVGSDSSDTWSKVSNIYTVELGTKCFAFGFDSNKDLPYIQFPSDVVSLIGDGLTVRYTLTSGALGNIAANTLSTLLSSTTATSDNGNTLDLSSYLTISNLSSSTDGCDPETVEEAYNNFKRVVGTFDTLVTCRDYENYLYYLNNSLTKDYWVSNIKVGDRRNDINYSNSYVSYGDYGDYTKHFNNTAKEITPYELCLYPLNKTKPTTEASYNKSFTQLKDSDSMWTDFESDNDDIRCISIDKKKLADDDIYLIKNYYKLKVVIYTYSKVTTAEQKDIVNNIKSVLYDTFYARNLEYGYRIPTETLTNIMINADSRIKSVYFDDPDITTKVLYNNISGEFDLNTVPTGLTSTALASIATQNILQGHVSLFNENTDFNFELGQVVATDSADTAITPIYNDIKTLNAEVTIDKDTTSGYTLKNNEVIEILSPAILTDITYPQYVNYRFEADASGASAFQHGTGYDWSYDDYITEWNKGGTTVYYYISGQSTHATTGKYIDASGNIYSPWSSKPQLIPNTNQPVTYYTAISLGTDATDKLEADVDHELTGKEKVFINYLDESDEEHNVVYTATTITTDGIIETVTTPVIIRPNFEIEDTDYRDFYTGKTRIQVNGEYYITMGADQEIAKRSIAKTTMDDVNLYCFWFVNNPTNTLFSSGVTSRILNSGEYFVYTDTAKSTLVRLGAGYRITRDATDEWSLALSDYDLTIDDLLDSGIDAFNNIEPFIIRTWQAGNTLTVEQLDIITLTSGSIIKTTGQFDNDINNTLQDIRTAVYPLTYDTSTLNEINISGCTRQIRSDLIINCGQEKYQTLLENQAFIFNKDDTTEVTITGKSSGINVNLSNLYQLVSVGTLDLHDYYLSGKEITYDDPVNAFVWAQGQILGTDTGATPSTTEYKFNSDDEIIFDTTGMAKLEIPTMNYTLGKQLFSIYTVENSSVTVTNYAEITATGGNIVEYNSGATPGASLNLNPGLITIEVDPSVTKLTIEPGTTNPNTNIVIRRLIVCESTGEINPDLGLSSTEKTAVLANIKARTDGDFDYTQKISNSKALNSYKLNEPECYFDWNNIATGWTLPEIDFTNSTFVIAKSMRG